MKKSLFISLALISSTVPFIASAQSKITELGNSIKAINSSDQTGFMEKLIVPNL
jgi:hypothetical protein